MAVNLSGTVAITGNVTMDPTLPLVAVAGSTTSVSVLVGNAVSFSLFSSVTGGYPPYTYSILSGTLPQGLTLNSSLGIVSGTTTALYSAANVVFVARDYFNNQAATTVTVNFTVLGPSYTINYLVVGGGGAGGTNGGGGGGGGGVLTGCATVNLATSYTITVGGGGTGKPAGPACASFNSTNGSPSFICGTGVSLVGIGGGYGGNFLNCNPGKPGGPGGSGGGGAGWNSSGVTVTNFGTGTPGQGFPGGQLVTNGCGSSGGGGGGAGGTGTGMPPAPNFGGGAGGVGYTWPLNGVGYGGGGGGGASRQPAQPSAVGGNSPTSVFGLGGAPFGGGVGGGSRVLPAPLIPTNPVNGSPGTNGRGGGGGGSSIAPSPGINSAGSGNGGSGTVILAVPNFRYPTVVAPGAAVSNPPAAPGQTVLTYTAASPLTPSTFTFTA